MSCASRFRARVAAAHADDRGSALLEFLTLGVLLLVPVVYLVVCLGELQGAAFAVEGASREAARVLAAAPDEEEAARQVDAVVAMALRDQGLAQDGDPAPVVTVECSQNPCTVPETQVRVTVEVEVVLPGVPAFIDAAVPARVPVRATGESVVERFAGVAP